MRKAYSEGFYKYEIDSSTLSTLTRLLLNLNHFEFEDKYFLQVSGTPMGTQIAQNYASIFVASLKSNFLSSQAIKPAYFKRYIDDAFLIWPHSEAELLDFISHFNYFHPTIKLTHSFSQSSINCLDVSIQIKGNMLPTKI